VLGPCSPATPASLAPGASVVCTATHAVTQADVDAGSYTNLAVGESDQTGPDAEDATVPILQNPMMSVAKSVTVAAASVRVEAAPQKPKYTG
jgi:hypothetical protein